jgi:glycosyltransferase involved in cell wall biosynthesis
MPPARRVLIAHPSPDLYGSDRQLLETISGLREDGWDVAVYLPADGPLRPLLAERGAHVHVAPFPVLSKSVLAPRRLLSFAGRNAVTLAHLVGLIRRSRPDLVWVNTITVPVWLLAARLCGVATLCHVHEAEEDQPGLVRRALAAPLLLAREVVANSAAARRSLVDVVPQLLARTRVVHNGVPLPPEPPTPARDRSPQDPLRLVVVGRLSPRKGTDVALDALALVRAGGVDAHLVLCGTTFPGYEWFERDLRARAGEPDLAGHVTFAGYVHPTWPALADADVVLVPSRAEPFGNTAVEALHARRPVVVSAVQGLAEIVDDAAHGIRVTPGDARELADAVTALARDPRRARELADTGQRVAAERFAPAGYRRAIAAVAAGVTRSGRPAPTA